jgi:glycopeptide antibiotics resistance protein
VKRVRPILVVATLGYAGVLAGLAFVRWSNGAECPWYWAVIAFAPAGILLQLSLGPRRWWAAIGFGVLGAAWIEAAQSIWMPLGYGRFEDVAWGALGITIGVLIGALVLRSMRSHESFSIVTEAGSREIP